MTDHCPDCGANLAIVGRVHRCMPRPAATSQLMANSLAVNNRSAVNNVINKPDTQTQALLTRNASRQTKWRNRHIDLNRQRAREGMRKLRAERRPTA